MTLRDALQWVYDKHGRLTPDLIIGEARANDGEQSRLLHGRLEWDDAVGGEANRRQQAHELIRTVRVVYKPSDKDGEERSVREWYATRTATGYVYEPKERVLANPLLERLVLLDMERDWRSLYNRYEHFSEFRDLVRRDLDQPDQRAA